MDFDLSEIFGNIAFWVLAGVGYFAFVIMLFVLKGMKSADIMPWWVKIVVLIAIPVVAALFSGYASN